MCRILLKNHFRLILNQMLKEYKEHPLIASERDIMDHRRELSRRLEKFRAHQTQYMDMLGTLAFAQQSCNVEKERLFLPSEFSTEERERLSLQTMAEEEKVLRVSQACELIVQLRSMVKHLSVLRDQKVKHVRGQKNNTRAHTRIAKSEFIRDHLLESYSASRTSLNYLGYFDSPAALQQFPELTLQSLFRKSTASKRRLGETYHPDGGLWTVGASSTSAPDFVGLTELRENDPSSPTPIERGGNCQSPGIIYSS
jgi:hypothetical protein